jgi:hypothetical protein
VRGFPWKKSSSVEKIKSGALTTCRNLGGATTRASRRKTRGTNGAKVDGREARNVTPPRLFQSIGILFDLSLTSLSIVSMGSDKPLKGWDNAGANKGVCSREENMGAALEPGRGVGRNLVTGERAEHYALPKLRKGEDEIAEQPYTVTGHVRSGVS